MKELDVRSITDAIVADYHAGRTVDKLSLSGQPDKQAITDIIDKLMAVLFNGYYRNRTMKLYDARTGLSVLIEDCMYRMEKQVAMVLPFSEKYAGKTEAELEREARQLTFEFFSRIPAVRAMLETDVEAFLEGDPAASSKDEIIYAYPGFFTIAVHRLAHELQLLKVPMIPRMMSEHAHSKTGIDIHPGATIGKYFMMDHGTGIVIGETAVIGDHVRIYQGVTLGALSTRGGQALKGVKRHPTVEDNVTVYANASVLGNIVIGHDSIIGGSAFITDSIPPDTRVSLKNVDLNIRTKSK